MDIDTTLLLTVNSVHFKILVNSVTSEVELHTHTVDIDTTLLLTVNSVAQLTIYTSRYLLIASQLRLSFILILWTLPPQGVIRIHPLSQIITIQQCDVKSTQHVVVTLYYLLLHKLFCIFMPYICVQGSRLKT